MNGSYVLGRFGLLSSQFKADAMANYGDVNYATVR